MITLTKKKTPMDYEEIEIKTNEGKFSIAFENNLDLYWYTPNLNTTEEKITYYINKENYIIYNEFDILYDSIKNNAPHNNMTNYEWEISEYDKLINSNRELFINNEVIWHSDEHPYDESSKVTISKEEDVFKIVFQKSNCNGFNYDTHSIRFRNSGSRYKPYNATFMHMYNNLCKKVNEHHQVHIEEYIYQRKKDM